ncbi:MAG: hypothetical protein HYR74_13205 [Candidatus Eisenbacteria bacterium]|nr:hypothetical protein [Candidatus Eisenbacteria bacterium]
MAGLLPGQPPGVNFKNPFDKTTGSGNAWVAAGSWAVPLATGSTKAGITAYLDSAAIKYQVGGVGKSGDLPLVLSSGQ